jgi:hypothetical protein
MSSIEQGRASELAVERAVEQGHRRAVLAELERRTGALRDEDFSPRDVLPSSFGVLDLLLPGGGIPRGRLTEISGARSSGKRALATAFCASALAAGQHAIWIDARGDLGRYTPLCGLEAGLPLSELLVVRPRPKVADSRDSLAKAAYRAADLVLGCGPAAALLVIELPRFGELRGSRQASKLSRLSKAASSSGTALLFISEKPSARDSLGTFVALHLIVGRDPRHRLRITVAKSKLGKMAESAEVSLDEPHSVRLDSTV